MGVHGLDRDQAPTRQFVQASFPIPDSGVNELQGRLVGDADSQVNPQLDDVVKVAVDYPVWVELKRFPVAAQGVHELGEVVDVLGPPLLVMVGVHE